jgi:hypothetical protein
MKPNTWCRESQANGQSQPGHLKPNCDFIPVYSFSVLGMATLKCSGAILKALQKFECNFFKVLVLSANLKRSTLNLLLQSYKEPLFQHGQGHASGYGNGHGYGHGYVHEHNMNMNRKCTST